MGQQHAHTNIQTQKHTHTHMHIPTTTIKIYLKKYRNMHFFNTLEPSRRWPGWMRTTVIARNNPNVLNGSNVRENKKRIRERKK